MPKIKRRGQGNSDKKFSFYSESDTSRLFKEKQSDSESEPYRSPFRRDYARILHSPSFRRLTSKTQLYPGVESDFFRNRLTHSLEVAQIAKSIGLRLNHTENFPDGTPLDLDLDLLELAALAHDLGHPPFGHQGEKALDECMLENGGFEGNAQTLRILSKLEKKGVINLPEENYGITEKGHDDRIGLNLTVRSLASILKYDKVIPRSLDERYKASGITESEDWRKIKPFKGYYRCEEQLVEEIKKKVIKGAQPEAFKTIECQIMDIADDIAYSTYDLEDGLKAGFFHPMDIVFSKASLLKSIGSKLGISETRVQDILIEIFQESVFKVPTITGEINDENFQSLLLLFTGIYYKSSKSLAKNGYERVNFTAKLVSQFVKGVRFTFNNELPALSKVFLEDSVRLKVDVLKTFNFESMILSPRLKIAEYRGKDIVTFIFRVLKDEDGDGFNLMPKDFQKLYLASTTEDDKLRVICDYIAGMTDRYCIEFFGRLTSENPETIFKPF